MSRGKQGKSPRWAIVGSVVGVFLVTLVGTGYGLAGPYLLFVVAPVAILPALLVGSLALFQPTRRASIWVLWGVMLLIGGMGGVIASIPEYQGDKALALEMLRVLWLMWLFIPIAPFMAVGVLLCFRRASRKYGIQVLLSMAFVPLGGLLAWYAIHWVAPEWRNLERTEMHTISAQCRRLTTRCS